MNANWLILGFIEDIVYLLRVNGTDATVQSLKPSIILESYDLYTFQIGSGTFIASAYDPVGHVRNLLMHGGSDDDLTGFLCVCVCRYSMLLLLQLEIQLSMPWMFFGFN